LLSTDPRIVPAWDPDGNRWADWMAVSGLPMWTPVQDDYITTITVVNHSATYNAGMPAEAIVGYFKPLLKGYAGDEDLYFMLVNGQTHPDGDGNATSQTLTVTFDFGASGINALQRLDRDSGYVVPVDSPAQGWTHLGGTQYRLALTLDGGTGDLFKYATGAPFAGAQINAAKPGWMLLE
jgi:hypothetical protein